MTSEAARVTSASLRANVNASVSVLLPTTEWGFVPDQLATQLRADDELLVICDSPTDPVARCETPDGVRVLVAGDPENCSGKANALAYGMEHAENERFVWTDDDFRHDPDWLARIVAAGETGGVVTGTPVFVGNGWWRILEPFSAVAGSLGLYLGGFVWGGAVTFTREEVDVAALVRDLRRTVSDDGLLSARVDATALRSLSSPVSVPGDRRSVRERWVRFVKVMRFSPATNDITIALAPLLALVLALLAPVATAVFATAAALFVYRFFGVRRWTVILAFPSLLFGSVALWYGLAARTFEWGGRRYRWRDTFDVEVVDPE